MDRSVKHSIDQGGVMIVVMNDISIEMVNYGKNSLILICNEYFLVNQWFVNA